MSTLARHRLHSADYLAHERRAETRSEYLAGEVHAMTGASRAHNRITWNLVTALDPYLRQRGCEGYASDMRVRIPATDLYTYPDLVVVCQEPRFEDDHLDTLLNPQGIVEVLSPSTADYDRGSKFAPYRQLPSLQFYLLISQAEVRAELFVRQPDSRWLLSETTALDASLELPVVGASVALRDVYDHVPGLPP